MAKRKQTAPSSPTPEPTATPPVDPPVAAVPDGEDLPPEEVKPVHPTVNPRNALLASLSRGAMEETGNADAVALNEDESGIDEEAPRPNREALAAAAAAEANAAAEEEEELPQTPGPTPTTVTPEPKTHKVVVKGVETAVPEDEVIQAGLSALRHQGAAERALREAHELLQRSKQLAGDQPPPRQDSAPASAITDDARELAKTLQLGSLDDAARVVAAMMKGGHSEQDIQAVVARTVETHVRDVLDHNAASAALEQQVPEMLKDARVMAILSFEEKAARANGDNRPYSEVYRDIGKKVRDWLDGLKGPVPANPGDTPLEGVPPRTIQQRTEAKRSVVRPVPPAGGTTTPTSQPKARTGSDIVAEMRAARGNPDHRNTRRL